MQRLAMLVVLVATRAAHANTPPDDLESRTTWEVDTGIRAGTFRVGTWHPLALGGQVEAGLRFDRIALLAEFDWMWLPDPSVPTAGPTSPTIGGSAQRFGLDARYSLGKYAGPFKTRRGMTSRFVADWWIEAGLGDEKVTMIDGSMLDRRDLTFGIGTQLGARFGANRDHRFLGFYALRVTAAQGPSDAVMRCTTACAGSGSMDYMISFDWGVAFGG